MRYQTELMRSILTNETAQQIIDYVSPIYGDSYVGLWLFQAIGTALGEICEIAEQLRHETTPATADLLLDYWEKSYGIPTDHNMTAEQRQNRLLVRTQSHGPANPARLSAAVSAALGGVAVEIIENVEPNTFLVNIRESVESVAPAVAAIEPMKPAHLICKVRVASQIISKADMKVAIALTHSEKYRVEVLQ